jgi:serine/threonine-protein kinase
MRLPFLVHDISMSTPHGYAAVSPYRAADIWIVPLDTPMAARPLVASSAVEREPRMSRDGRLLAYTSNETGREEVYVRSVLGPPVIVQVSSDGAGQPVWSYDDRHLYYRGRAYVIRATIAREPTLRIVRRDTLFRDVYQRHNITNYDVFPNGKELLMIRARPTKVSAAVLMNWPELLDRRARGP